MLSWHEKFRSIEIDFIDGTSDAMLLFDDRMLQVTLLNVLSNALKF